MRAAGHGHFAVIHAFHGRAIRHRVCAVRHGHGAMIHTFMGHAHVCHGQEWRFAQVGDVSLHAIGRGECPAHGRCPAHGFREDGIRPVFLRLDENVVGLGNGNPELVDRHWEDVIAVCLHHRHFQTGYPDVEIGHGR